MRQLKISKSITNRESASLDKYLQEVGKEERITVEQEVELAKRIKQWDEAAFHKLARANLRFVISIAKQYQHQWLSLPDLINEGNLWLLKAAQKFDEERGFKFISYAVWRIRQSILQALAEQARIVRLPLNQIGKLGKFNKTFARLEQKFERQPTNEELAENLELSEKHIKEITSNNTRTVSLDSPLDAENPNPWNLLDVVASREFSELDSSLYTESLRYDMSRALDTLTPRETEIVKLFFWIDQERDWNLEEIWDKVGLTRERVRQIKEKAVRRLRNTLRSKHLKQYLW